MDDGGDDEREAAGFPASAGWNLEDGAEEAEGFCIAPNVPEQSSRVFRRSHPDDVQFIKASHQQRGRRPGLSLLSILITLMHL